MILACPPAPASVQRLFEIHVMVCLLLGLATGATVLVCRRSPSVPLFRDNVSLFN